MGNPIGGEEEKETRTEPEGANPGECTDGADNDLDGDYDCNDTDCSGAPDCIETDVDNNDNDNDNDNDGYAESVDCDDSDPNSTVMANDADCDGVLTCDDCDDSDPNIQECVGFDFVAEFLIDENSEAQLQDNSGNGHLGYLAQDSQWGEGYINTSSEYCATIDNVDFVSNVDHTIHFVVKGTENQSHNTPRMISFRGNGESKSLQVSTVGTGITLDRHTNYSQLSTIPILDGDWHLISYIEEGTTYSLYVDSELDHSATINSYFEWNVMDRVVLGGAICGHDHFDGSFAYVSFLNYAQPFSEIQQSYNYIKGLLSVQGVELQ